MQFLKRIIGPKAGTIKRERERERGSKRVLKSCFILEILCTSCCISQMTQTK